MANMWLGKDPDGFIWRRHNGKLVQHLLLGVLASHSDGEDGPNGVLQHLDAVDV